MLLLRKARSDILILRCDKLKESAKKLDYPAETEGSRLAAKVRALASKLTPEEDAKYFRRGMAKIYGGPSKEVARPRH